MIYLILKLEWFFNKIIISLCIFFSTQMCQLKLFKGILMGRSLGRFTISGVSFTICIGPFYKYVFRKFWIWARRFLLLGGPLIKA